MKQIKDAPAIPPAVSVRDVARVYPSRRGASEAAALDGVSLDIAPGEFVALLGPNGSGKSTLLRMLATLDVPTSGEVRVFDVPAHGDSRAIRARIGVLFQHESIDPLLTVRENLRTSAALYGLTGERAAGRIRGCAEELEIADRLDDRAGTLSGGFLRRTDLARALLHDPELLILDEPTTGLDPSARRSFMDAIDRRREAGALTVVMSTHLLDEAERADRICLLASGRLVADGSLEHLRDSIGAPLVVSTDAKHASVLEQFGLRVINRGGIARAAADEASAQSAATLLIGSGARVSVGSPSLDDVYEHFAGVTLDAGAGA